MAVALLVQALGLWFIRFDSAAALEAKIYQALRTPIGTIVQCPSASRALALITDSVKRLHPSNLLSEWQQSTAVMVMQLPIARNKRPG